MSEKEDNLLAKWLANDISEAELKVLSSKYDLDELSSILDRQDQYVPVSMDKDQMWDAIKEKQNISNKQTENPQKKPKNWIRFVSLLLAFLLAKIIYGFLFENNTIHVETTDEPKTELAFVDGSSAVIGPYSSLKYDQEQWSEKRKVNLKGQAFFDVTPGVSFSVSTTAGRVEVLGTQFDVWSIDSEYMRVSCREGRVRVTDNDGKSNEIGANQAIYISSGSLSEISDLPSSTFDWQQNLRNYQNTPVKILLSDIERFYEVTFTTDISSEKDVFSGVLPTDDLDKCVQFLETSLSYEAERSDKNIQFKKAK